MLIWQLLANESQSADTADGAAQATSRATSKATTECMVLFGFLGMVGLVLTLSTLSLSISL